MTQSTNLYVSLSFCECRQCLLNWEVQKWQMAPYQVHLSCWHLSCFVTKCDPTTPLRTTTTTSTSIVFNNTGSQKYYQLYYYYYYIHSSNEINNKLSWKRKKNCVCHSPPNYDGTTRWKLNETSLAIVNVFFCIFVLFPTNLIINTTSTNINVLPQLFFLFCCCFFVNLWLNDGLFVSFLT